MGASHELENKPGFVERGNQHFQTEGGTKISVQARSQSLGCYGKRREINLPIDREEKKKGCTEDFIRTKERLIP